MALPRPDFNFKLWGGPMIHHKDELRRQLAETKATMERLEQELAKADAGVMVAPGTTVECLYSDNTWLRVPIVGQLSKGRIVCEPPSGVYSASLAPKHYRTLDGRPIKGVLPVEFTRQEVDTLMFRAWQRGTAGLGYTVDDELADVLAARDCGQGGDDE